MKKRKKVGLALGSGGWRGIAHIGVISELEKYGIEIDYIAGTSAGALVGGLYAAQKDIKSVREVFKKNMNLRRLLYAFSDPRPRWGLFKGDRYKSLFEEYLGQQLIEECKIPFCAIATDILSGQVVELREGKISDAIRASSAVPFILQPVNYNSMKLVDGACVVPVPVKTVRQMGADVVIAVNLHKNVFPMKAGVKRSGISIALKTSQTSIYHLAEYTGKSADIVLKPDITESGEYTNPFTNFIKRDDILDDGERIVREKISEILSLLK